MCHTYSVSDTAYSASIENKAITAFLNYPFCFDPFIIICSYIVYFQYDHNMSDCHRKQEQGYANVSASFILFLTYFYVCSLLFSKQIKM